MASILDGMLDVVWHESVELQYIEAISIGTKLILKGTTGSMVRRGDAKPEQDALMWVKTELECLRDGEVHRQNIKRSCKRSYGMVYDLCHGIGVDRMLTLTFQENIVDINLALKAWKEFIRLCHVRWHGFEYVCVPEVQKRGAIHFHVGLTMWRYWQTMLFLWRKAVKVVSNMTGGIYINRKCGGTHEGVAKYIAKYVSKAFYCADNSESVGRKRYYSNVAVDKVRVRIPVWFFDVMLLGHHYNGIAWVAYEQYLGDMRALFGIDLKSFVEKYRVLTKFCGFCWRYDGVVAL